MLRKFLYTMVALGVAISATGCANYRPGTNHGPLPTRTVAPPLPQTRPRSEAPPVSQAAVPAATTENVRAENIKTTLATHQTEFSTNETGRATNISLASQAIHNHIIDPGATFSYNEVVGPTNERRGYKKSTIFVEGEKEEGFGGGVCQVSTTLYNAAKEAGLTILERHDHSLPVTYAESGDEAATSYGGIDFKFKNDKAHPVQITSTVENGKITVSILAV